MNEPIRVLQVMASLDRGGAEAVVMDWLRSMDRSRVQFDFVVNEGGPYSFEEEAEELGSRIVRAPRFRGWNAASYAIWWRNTFASHPEWGIVHAHHTVPAFIYLSVARRLGRATVAHSHNAGRDRNLDGVIRGVLRRPLRLVAETHLACSEDAGDWMFGKNTNVRVVHNAINTAKFAFDEEDRLRVRRELNWEDAIIVGHVGSFMRQKNHSRLLQIFAEFWEAEPRARLLLVGDGGLRSQLQRQAGELGIDDNVLFVGVRKDIPALLSAMDIFLFPSHYEGLGVALIEAQASGLPCLASDVIPRDAKLTDLVSFLPLDAPDSLWVDAARQSLGRGPRKSHAEEVKAAGYDSNATASEMQNFYQTLQPRRGPGMKGSRRRGPSGPRAQTAEPEPGNRGAARGSIHNARRERA